MTSEYNHHPSNLEDESEDNISLCDLPIHGYETHYTTTPSEVSMKDEETFEFFTEQEWLKNHQDSIFFPNKGILFGGNSILPNIPTSRNTQEFKKHDHKTTKDDLGYGFSLTCESFKLASMNKHGMKKVSIPASASMRSRWYYYGIGLAGVPTEMELSSIRSRQNRHRKSHPVGEQGGGPKEDGGGFKREKGLGRLIREMICDGHTHTQANSMVKASLVCIPRG